MRRLVVVVALLALVAAGCTSGHPSALRSPTAPTNQPAAQTFNVKVDGTSPALNLISDAFYPNALSVHPGDTITFNEVWTGEIHTVTFGTLVDAAVTGAPPPAPPSPSPSPSGRSTGRASPSPSPPPPGLVALPDIFPPPGFTDAIPAAANACYLDTGVPPAGRPCPARTQPAFSGSQSFYNSGWLTQGSSFNVTISPTTAAGVYHFRCLVHPEMTGQVTVVPVGTPVPLPNQVSETASSQLSQAVQAELPAVGDAQTLTSTVVDNVPEIAGLTENTVTNTFVAAFYPPTISARVSQTVVWSVYGMHALALNAPDTATGPLERGADGSVHLNTVVTRNTGGVAPPIGPPKTTVVSGGSYSGTGFHNSGLLTSSTAGLLLYTLSFSAPGTYTLRCLVHPGMTETINVTG